MTNSIHLQSIGRVPAKPAGELKAGDVTVWNFGSKSEVLEVVKETAKTVTLKMICRDRYGSGEEYERRFNKTRLVACC